MRSSVYTLNELQMKEAPTPGITHADSLVKVKGNLTLYAHFDANKDLYLRDYGVVGIHPPIHRPRFGGYWFSAVFPDEGPLFHARDTSIFMEKGSRMQFSITFEKEYWIALHSYDSSSECRPYVSYSYADTTISHRIHWERGNIFPVN